MNLFDIYDKRIIDLEMFSDNVIDVYNTENFIVSDIGDGFLYVSNYEWLTMKITDWIENLNDEFVDGHISKKEWLNQLEEFGDIMDKFRNKDNKKLVL
jgi:RecA-family ATPase